MRSNQHNETKKHLLSFHFNYKAEKINIKFPTKYTQASGYIYVYRYMSICVYILVVLRF